MRSVRDEKQGKNTEARQRKRAANQEAGDKAGHGKGAEARQGNRGSAPRFGREQKQESSSSQPFIPIPR